MRKCLFFMFFLVILPLSAEAETVYITADRDATIIEYGASDCLNAVANGSGEFFFAGPNNQPAGCSIRRGLIYFDVASVVPEKAIIESVALNLYQSQGNLPPAMVGIYRVQSEWSEGPSVATGGIGAPAQQGDVTWFHTYFDMDFWGQTGGNFIGRESASALVGGNGWYRWEDSNHMVNDVRLWISNPGQNNGWVLIGEETQPQTAKRFASRENSVVNLRPFLEISYR